MGHLLVQIESLSESIKELDKEIDAMVAKHPGAKQLEEQIAGVGGLTALTFVLTLEDPECFKQSRDVGAYLGMVPKQRQSGQRSPQLRITKTGDRYLRSTLVQCAHYILSRRPDSELKRWGEAHVGTNANQRKRTIVAMARNRGGLRPLLPHPPGGAEGSPGSVESNPGEREGASDEHLKVEK